jgi:hypothetical protein
LTELELTKIIKFASLLLKKAKAKYKKVKPKKIEIKKDRDEKSKK